jgi:hypothetical protein
LTFRRPSPSPPKTRFVLLTLNSAFEKKSGQSTKVRSSTEKVKRSDHIANAKVSSSLPPKRHRSDEMTMESTGSPSTERAPKALRHKKTQAAAGATKTNLQSFGTDCSLISTRSRGQVPIQIVLAHIKFDYAVPHESNQRYRGCRLCS